MTIPSPLFKPLSKPWQPHEYQKKAVEFLLNHACGALLLDPGLGKTSIALAAIKILKRRGLLQKVLVIAPMRVCYSVWMKETELWTDFHGLRVEILHGAKKLEALKRDADIYVINPEGLNWLFRANNNFPRRGFDTLIIDELSKFKHTSTQRFKSLKPVLSLFRRRWGLTGSPASNGLLDLFGQCYILDEGNALGRYITHYRSQFFTSTGYGGYTWVLQKGAEQRIYERIAPLALRMAAEDYLRLPRLTDNVIAVDLPRSALKVYEELENELLTKIADNTITAVNAAAAATKCRQVACGGLYLDSVPLQTSRDWVNLHTAKIDALADLVEELQGAPLLVAYEFKHDLDRFRARFGQDIAVIGGGTSPQQTEALAAQWNAGALPLLFGHPQAMAHGLNLQSAGRHICWHSLPWNYELYMQLIRRVYRQGNTASHIVVHHIVARDTIDETILHVLRAKARGQNAFFEALKARQDNIKIVLK